MKQIDDTKLELIYAKDKEHIREEVWHDPTSMRNRIVSKFNEQPYIDAVKDYMSVTHTGKENGFFNTNHNDGWRVIARIPKWIANHFPWMQDAEQSARFYKWLDGPGKKWKTLPVNWTSTTNKNALFNGFSSND